MLVVNGTTVVVATEVEVVDVLEVEVVVVSKAVVLGATKTLVWLAQDQLLVALIFEPVISAPEKFPPQ